MKSAILQAQIHKDVAHVAKRQVALLACREFEKRTIKRDVSTGPWFTVMHTHDSGMIPSPGEWRDGCFLRYVMSPPKLLPIYNGCGGPFSVEHGNTCRTP